MIARFLKKYGWQYIPGILFLFASSYVAALAPLALGRAIDGLSALPPDRATVTQQALAILYIGMGVFATRFIWRYFIVGNARNMETFLRDELYMKLQRLPPTFFNHTKTGDLMAYAINDVGAIRMTFGPAISLFFNGISTAVFSISAMAGEIDPRLTLLTLLPIPLASFVTFKLGGRVRRQFRRVQEMFSEVSGRVQENIYGMRVLKAYVQEDAQISQYARLSGRMMQANIELANTSSLVHPAIQFFFGLSYLISLIYGGNLALSGTISVGEFVAFTGYLSLIMMPVLSLGRIVTMVQRGMASLKRMQAILERPEIPEFEDQMTNEPITGDICIKGLSFTYPDATEKAISDFSVTVKRGETLGIVGPTGCGKTTIAHLLMKFYNPPRGRVFIGGKDIRQIPARALREQIGFVPQDGFLFNTTIAENITFFQPDADEEKLKKAAELSALSRDLGSFSNGYETQVGERGSHISGGQKQRVALARALIRDPEFLILDDTLSAVDAQTERFILDQLKTKLAGRTSIIISHRLSAVENAHQILYIEHGRIVERGTHEELMALGRLYADTYRRQHEQTGGEAA